MPEMDCRPTNKYLPPRPRRDAAAARTGPVELADASPDGGFLGWIDTLLSD